MKSENKQKKKSLTEKTRTVQIATLVICCLSLVLSVARIVVERVL